MGGKTKGNGSSPVKTFDLKDFAGGWDLREGLFSEQQNRFTDLLNVYVTVGKKVRRRPPLTKLAGAYDTANAQGLIYSGGKWYTIAKKGTAPVHTIVGITLNTLSFDNPDYCTAWTLIQAKTFNNVVCALIKHTFPGATVTSRYMLHVFDGKANKPTYVEDPACPTNWAPSFPLGLYGQNPVVGAFDGVYVPTMGVGGNHLWIARPDGNPACSKVNNPRAWNQRTVNDFLNGGEWWYFIIPNNGASAREFIISENFANLANWAGYVLEYIDATGTWQKFIEDDAAPTVDKHCFPASVASRFAGGYANEIKMKIFWTGATDVVIRWRAVANPTVKLVTGCGYTVGTDTLAAGTFTYEGNNYALAGGVIGGTTDGSAIGASTIYQVYTGFGPPSVGSNNAVGAFKIICGNAVAAEQLNGWRRYSAYIEYYDFENTLLPSSKTGLYVYPGATGVETAWYLAKLSDYTINQAGFGEASFLNTQNNNPDGGYLKAMGNLLAHMTFSYVSCTQLWTIAANPANDAYQTKLDLGVGDNQSAPVPVGFYDLVMLPTPTGLRGFNMEQGLLVNTLQDNNVGEPIMGAALADLTVACWWPYLGAYITAGVLGGAVQWYLLSESRESKISAWSRWTAVGIATIEAMVPLQNKLYIKSGTGICYFDGSQTITENGVAGTGIFRDSNDPAGAGNAYVSSGRWHFNNLERPGSEKDFIGLDVVQTGIATWAFGMYPKDLTALSASIPVDGTSSGDFPYSLGFSGSGIAPQFSSTDETGFLLEGVSIAFAYLGRG